MEAPLLVLMAGQLGNVVACLTGGPVFHPASRQN